MKAQFSMKMTGLLVALISTLTVSSAFANQVNHKMDRKVARTCAQVNSLSFPAGNTKLNQADTYTEHACVRQYREKVATCANNHAFLQSNGQVKPGHVKGYRACQAYALKTLTPGA